MDTAWVKDWLEQRRAEDTVRVPLANLAGAYALAFGSVEAEPLKAAVAAAGFEVARAWALLSCPGPFDLIT